MKQTGFGRIHWHFLFLTCFGVFQLHFCLSLNSFRCQNTWYVTVTHLNTRYSFKATSFTSRAVVVFRSEKIGKREKERVSIFYSFSISDCPLILDSYRAGHATNGPQPWIPKHWACIRRRHQIQTAWLEYHIDRYKVLLLMCLSLDWDSM